MRLGVLIDRFDARRGGAEAHTDALLRRALETGDTAALACVEGAPPPGVDLVRVAAGSGSRAVRDRAFAEAGPKALRDAGCDVVFAVRHALACDVYLPHGGLVLDALAAHDASTPSSALSRWWARRSGKRAFFLEAERALLAPREGPRVVAVSQGLAARIAAIYPGAKPRTTVVPNGVDADRFDPAPFREGRGATRRALGIPEDAYVGLHLAHAPWLKGLLAVLEAMARPEAARLSPAFHLVVAGRRAGGDVRRRARRLGVGARVHPAGEAEDPRPLYAAADVLVHPTFHDPCSLVTLEALSMAVPVVTTPQNGAWELMGMRGGIAVSGPTDAEGVATALAVLSDPRLRAETADDARYVAKKNRLATRLDAVLAVARSARRT